MTKVLFESGKFWLELEGEKVEIVNPEIHIKFWKHGNLHSGDTWPLPEEIGYTLDESEKVAILHLIEQPKESEWNQAIDAVLAKTTNVTDYFGNEIEVVLIDEIEKLKKP